MTRGPRNVPQHDVPGPSASERFWLANERCAKADAEFNERWERRRLVESYQRPPRPVCDTKDCGRPSYAKGLCHTCYQRAWRADK